MSLTIEAKSAVSTASSSTIAAPPFGALSAAGELIVVDVTFDINGGGVTVAVTDNAVAQGGSLNTYTKILEVDDTGNDQGLARFQAVNQSTTTGPITPTAAFTIAGGPSSRPNRAILSQRKTVGTTYDSTAGSISTLASGVSTSGTAANNCTTAASTPSTITPTANGSDIDVVVVNAGDNTAIAVGTGVAFTDLTDTNAGAFPNLLESFSQTTAAAVTPTARIPTTGIRYMMIASVFKPATVAPTLPAQQPSRSRRWWPKRRAYRANPVPTVVVVTTQTLPPQPGRRARPFRPRRVPEYTIPVPASVAVVSTPLLPQLARPRRAVLPRRHATSTTVLSAIVTVSPQPQRRSVRAPLRRRGFVASVPITVSVTPPANSVRRLVRLPHRRAFTAVVVQVGPNVGVAPLPPQPARRVKPWPLRARPHVASPVAAGTPAPTLQALPPQQPRPVQHGWLGRRKGRTATFIPTGTAAPTTQALPPQQARAVMHGWLPRRRTQVSYVPVTVTVQVVQPVRRRLPLVPPRRRSSTQPVITTIPITLLVPQPRRRRLVPILPRRGHSSTVPPVTVVVTPHPIPPQPRRNRFWPIPRRRQTTEIHLIGQSPNPPVIPYPVTPGTNTGPVPVVTGSTSAGRPVTPASTTVDYPVTPV